jgi:phenylalanyl-tRNA synthetase beta subunit
MSLLPSLLEKIHPNIKAGYGQFGLFEIGKTHLKNWLDEEKLPKEEERLAFIFAADSKLAQNYSGAPFFQTIKYLSELLSKMGIEYELLQANEDVRLAINEQMTCCLDAGRLAIIVNKSDGVFIGAMGDINAEVRQKLKLPDFCAGFELDISTLLKYKNSISNYHPLSKFPKVEQDITLKCPSSVNFAELYEFLYEQLKLVCQKDFIYELSPLSIYSPEKAEHKNFSFRLSIASCERTLKSQEVNELLDNISQKANQQLKSSRI